MKTKNKVKKTITAVLAAAITTMSFSNMMTASAANSSNTYRIYYNVNANSGVSSMSANLNYDYSKVEVKRLYKGTLGGSAGFSQTVSGKMDVSYSNSSNVNTAGTLIVVTFSADSSVTNLMSYVTSTVKSVKNTAGTSLSTTKVSTATVLVGDVDQDGTVQANDMLILKKYLLGTETITGNALKAADADGDFDVDNDDLELLKNYLLGISDFNK